MKIGLDNLVCPKCYSGLNFLGKVQNKIFYNQGFISSEAGAELLQK